jgi:hypothetical protein
LKEMTEKQKFEQWAYVELMGHQSIVGRCTEESLAGSNMLRVDVPHGESFFTRYFGGSAIYAISPISEEAAKRMISRRGETAPPFAYQLQESRLPRVEHSDDVNRAIVEDDDEDEQVF